MSSARLAGRGWALLGPREPPRGALPSWRPRGGMQTSWFLVNDRLSTAQPDDRRV